ncbi:hypothetical protein [Flavobacterium aquidurense]|uniref:hypothetical protein n=1 Tax=Flavobacterium aquidurense TaxID=362413 RepID=UPI0028631018|nr:hypothetical protein [Flavobacterium aquidurense]MDR7370236.1 hypothetical protein [Flavobacterium aquidurense]
MKKYIFLALLFFILKAVHAQDCTVLLKNIDNTYEGDCKKGKADGQGLAKGIDNYKGQFKKGLPDGVGTYTWQDGKIYEGEFSKGLKEGQGKLIVNKDSIITGFWKKDVYIGLFDKPYKKISKSPNVSSYAINKVQDDINNLRFYIKVNQEPEKYPRINFIVHSGSFQTQIDNNDFVELTNVTYPIKLKASYNQDFIEIEIFQPGLWEIKTDITYIKGLN